MWGFKLMVILLIYFYYSAIFNFFETSRNDFLKSKCTKFDINSVETLSGRLSYLRTCYSASLECLMFLSNYLLDWDLQLAVSLLQSFTMTLLRWYMLTYVVWFPSIFRRVYQQYYLRLVLDSEILNYFCFDYHRQQL